METTLEYQGALDYLFSHVDFSRTHIANLSPDNFTLANMHALVTSLGDPHSAYPVIHVAGTKGKGSVAALCASALQAAGYRVGLNTSPHLQDYSERIQINGNPISQGEFTELIKNLKPYVEAIPGLTTFEIGTALAFWHFACYEVDIAIFEVGLGGRVDSTNVVTPQVAVITSISFDHTPILGTTLAEIAAEKAGIIKADLPVVVAPQPEEARQTITHIATEHAALLTQVGEDLRFAAFDHNLEGQRFWVWTADQQTLMDRYLENCDRSEWKPIQLHIPLLGAHQVENAATAFATLQVARANGLKINIEDIQRGFTRVQWPGRFEILYRDPFLVVDAAHNRDSAYKLRLAMETYFPDKAIILVFATLADKDVEGMLTELLPAARDVIATQTSHPRHLAAEKAVPIAQTLGYSVNAIPMMEQAFEKAWHLANGDTVVLVTGGIATVGVAGRVWHTMKNDLLSAKSPRL